MNDDFELNEDIHQYPIKPAIKEYFAEKTSNTIAAKVGSTKEVKKPETPSILNNNQKMAVVTCHFNWCKFINPARNLHRFIRQMRIDKIPLFGVELSLTDEFETSGIEGWKQIKVSKENICFQKEACINLAVNELVPKKYERIAWIDSDLSFTNRNWYAETYKKLHTYKVVQLFQYTIETDRYGRETLTGQGSVFAGGPNRAGGRRAPGGAWAAHRELWSNGGLFPFCPLGGGDIAFLYAIYENSTPHTLSYLDSRPDYALWRKRVYNYVSKSISYVNGNFVHEWHGDKESRSYQQRQTIFTRIPHKNINLNTEGILEIRNEADELYNDIYNYFLGRNEDGATATPNIKQKVIKSVSYDYCVIITTYDREDMLKLLLEDIKRNSEGKRVLTVVFDDGSPNTIDYTKYDIKYVKYVNNYGKKKFWKLIDNTFKYIERIEAKYYFYLQDDLRMVDGFFEKAIELYEKIPDKSKICLSTLTIDTQINNLKFTKIPPIQFDEYIKTQWCEFFFLAEKRFFEKLNYEIYSIDDSRWEQNPLLGSGVGQQISERLISCDANLYHCKKTLLSHGNHDSKMNPDDRKIVNLIVEI